ncbi:hypothetical protein R2601_03483 [Salipiger bermudensis HTCC2601]|uniref:Uncharacterized protein n=1 Tax=Salipiger bermudensis (strain DSM 26914 / JCM 13377 / KCTC 12554 / HTCC2601) TaxID=314265 RepID=Q0FWE9_SALBH|nr:hypothetical protein R2601_03483 [Salipiger bermudensis HTCC2601]
MAGARSTERGPAAPIGSALRCAPVRAAPLMAAHGAHRPF